MLPRKLIEEFVSGNAATGFHVVVTFANGFDGLAIILTLPFEVLGQSLVERIGGAFSPAARELFELSQSFGLDR